MYAGARTARMIWCHVARVSCSGFFFFQAEDGIRDLTVTGVQTCALPISLPRSALRVSTVKKCAPEICASREYFGVFIRASFSCVSCISWLELPFLDHG